VLQGQEETVLKLIDEKELVDLAIDMGNITAPSGYEQPMADFVLRWLKENGFEKAYQQQLAEGRANAIGILKGRGEGKSLIFNSHMDSEQGMPLRIGQEVLPGPKAWLDEEGRIFGQAVQNDRGPMAAFMIATKAIKNSDIALQGDIIMTSVRSAWVLLTNSLATGTSAKDTAVGMRLHTGFSRITRLSLKQRTSV
jgi:acetylornithine deacetylase/succinyl-diaminopimelate desuccinylase-like protein